MGQAIRALSARIGARIYAGPTGLEPAASSVTGMRSNQLSYDPKALILTIGQDRKYTTKFLCQRQSFARLYSMSNKEIVRLFRNTAAAYSIKNEKKHYFQIIAYQKAADTIEGMSVELSDLYKEDKLQDIPGIGPTLRSHIIDLLTKGKSEHINSVLKVVPESVFPLLDVPSFGPKKAYRLVTEFKLQNPKTVLRDVKSLADDGKIAPLEGFGEKSQADISRALFEYSEGINKSTRMVLPIASEIADEMVFYMKKHKDVIDIAPLGSLRRKKETIGDIDLAVATNNPEAVLTYFTEYPRAQRTLEKGTATSSILVSGGKHIDLMVQKPESFGSLLQHFTGSKEHNVKLREFALKKGLSLSEYGIKKVTNKSKSEKVRESKETTTYNTEENFYAALGMNWIPPEIREGTNEIELALKNKLPHLVELKDIKGDFHLHSSFPIEPSHDLGQSPLSDMIKKALSLKYAYIGFSEHNPSISKHTVKQSLNLVQKRNEAIDQLQKSNKNIRIFKLLETDILPNGTLAINDDVLGALDATIVSVHSSFSMGISDMTKRVLKGLSHKKAKILAHPTGRLINSRSGYSLDWKEIFAFCKAEKKAIEINAWPYRLDLPDSLVRQAIESGVTLVIDSDSHAATQMDLMRFGVDVARRGWAEPENILNTWGTKKLEDFLLNP